MADKEAISNLNQIYGFVSSEIQQSIDLAIKALEERPQGEWEEYGEYKLDNHYFICSACGELEEETSNYCPNCGAEMSKAMKV